MKLEQIRQAESLNQVKHILGEVIEEDTDSKTDATWNNKGTGDFLQTKVKRLWWVDEMGYAHSEMMN